MNFHCTETFAVQIRVRVSDLSLTFPKQVNISGCFVCVFVCYLSYFFLVPARYKKFTFTLLPAILAPWELWISWWPHPPSKKNYIYIYIPIISALEEPRGRKYKSWKDKILISVPGGSHAVFIFGCTMCMRNLKFPETRDQTSSPWNGSIVSWPLE